MTDSTDNQTAAPKLPSHIAYNVEDREDSDSIWTPIGSAKAHRDGRGFNVELDDGRRIVLRVPSKKKSA